MKIKVLSYNIHKGLSISGTQVTIQKIKEAVHSLNPDIAFLQEVVGQHKKREKIFTDWSSIPQIDILSGDLYSFKAYGQNAHYPAGHHGNGIISRIPFEILGNKDLSLNRFEKRGLLHTVFDIKTHNLPLHGLCVHLNLLHKERVRQVQSICSHIEDLIPKDLPCILSGDFNDWGEKLHEAFHSIGFKEAFSHLKGKSAYSFPSIKPLLMLDRVYYRGITPIDCEILTGNPWNRLSDHTPLLVTFEL